MESQDSLRQRLVEDVTRVAEEHGVSHDADLVRQSLLQYAAFFSMESYIQLRVSRSTNTTGSTRRQLNFRAELPCTPGDGKAEQALREALQSLRIEQPMHRVLQGYLSQVLETFPTCATAADFDPARGLVKLWHFGRHTAGELSALPEAPQALGALQGTLQRHGLAQVLCTGVDLQRCSMNVYFRLHEGRPRGTEEVRALLRDLALEVPADEETLEYLAGPGSLAVTLRWETPQRCERACFYIVPPLRAAEGGTSRTAASGGSGQVVQGPAAWGARRLPSYLREFMDECALPAREGAPAGAHPLNSCFVSRSFGREEEAGSLCLKQESDWRGCYHDLLQRVADSVAARETPAPTAPPEGEAGAGLRRRARGPSSCLELVRETVAAVVRGGAHLDDDTPLEELGMDSATGAFLRGQLAALAGVPLPGAAVFDRPSIAGLAQTVAEARGRRAAQEGPAAPAAAEGPASQPGRACPRVRLVREQDWPALRELWGRHHHLLEAVAATTAVLVRGPPAWAALAAACLNAFFYYGTAAAGAWTLALYALAVLLQHALHWCCARMVLAADLCSGDLTAAAWAEPAPLSGRPRAAVLVAHAGAAGGGAAELAGAACVRLKPLWGGGPQHRAGGGSPRRAGCSPSAGRPAPPPRVASVWHAVVAPRYRGQGVATALLAGAEAWAAAAGALRVEVLCLGAAAKAVCWNRGYALWNPRTGRLPLVPAVFQKQLAPKRA